MPPKFKYKPNDILQLYFYIQLILSMQFKTIKNNYFHNMHNFLIKNINKKTLNPKTRTKCYKFAIPPNVYTLSDTDNETLTLLIS